MIEHYSKPTSVTFLALITTSERVVYLQKGIIKICGDAAGIETATDIPGRFAVTIRVPSSFAVEVFTYLLMCMDVGGFCSLLTILPIVGEPDLAYHQERDAVKNPDGTYTLPTGYQAGQTVVFREKEQPNDE